MCWGLSENSICLQQAGIIGYGGGPQPVTYSDHAKEAFFLGMTALEDSNYIDAIEHLNGQDQASVQSVCSSR